MGKKYLLLGASSDLCCAFLRQHKWEAEDEIIAQYFRSKDNLMNKQLYKASNCIFIIYVSI